MNMSAEIRSSQSTLSINDDENRVRTDADSDALNDEIDGYKEVLISGGSATAKKLLYKLKDRSWDTASKHVKFRLITNIAACDLKLGNTKEAIRGFREAFEISCDKEVAHGNIILAEILNRDVVAAHQKAADSLKQFPDSEVIISYYISTCSQESPEFIPEKFAGELADTSGVVAYGIYGYYKNYTQSSSVLEWASRAYELDSEKFEIRLSYATEILEDVSIDQTVLIGKQISVEREEVLNKAKAILGELFKETIATEEHTSIELIANNLALCHRLMGNYTEAIKVIDGALNIISSDESLEKFRIALHIDLEQWKIAESLISHIEPSADPQYILMKVECFRGQEKYAEARREIESYLDRHPDIDERDIFIAYLAELIYRDSGYSEARAFGEKEIAKDAGIHTQISIAKIHRWNDGLAEAQSLVFQSLTLIGDTSSYNDKFFVAEEAYYCGLFDRAADILFNLIQQYVDSPPLRRLLACLYELDDRVMFSDLLSKLPQEVKDLPYYAKYSAAYYTKIGDDKGRKWNLIAIYRITHQT